MSEASHPKQQIQYDQLSDRHDSIIRSEIKKLADRGIDFELNYHVAFATWQEIRRARGMIIQSLSDEARLMNEFYDQETKIEKPLSFDEIDRLSHLVTLASLNNGVLFWTRNLTPDNKLLAMHTKVLEKMQAMTSQIQNPDEYSRFGNAQVMYTFNEWLINYFEHGVPKSDNLGEHFRALDKPHIFLDGISIRALKKQIAKHPTTIVVLAPAASSGVLEAGIFAHYMSEKLHIPTTVDPVFFSKGYGGRKPINITNRVMPGVPRIVIPLDDRIMGTGYSPVQAKEGAERKYGKKSLVMSRKMEKLSRLREERKTPVAGAVSKRD